MLASVLRRSSRHRMRLGALAGLAVSALVLGLTASSLLDHAVNSEAGEQLATDIMVSVRTVDGLEWRAAAGEPIGELRAAISGEANRLRELLKQDRTVSKRLSEPVERYLEAVDAEINATVLGQLDAAKEIDRDLVDPRFDAINELSTKMAAREKAKAEATLRTIRAVLRLGSVGVVALVGSVLWLLQSARDRARSRQLGLAAERRFRSLVQSSTDVITLVSLDGDVTLMSPSLGGLQQFSSSPHPRSIGELLTSEQLDRWQVADGDLRRTGAAQQIEVVHSRPDGVTASFEGRGTRLIDQPDLTVWSWTDISARKQVEGELAHRAFHDTLTGLPNRAMLETRLEHALGRGRRTGQSTALLFCDLDEFKSVNDTLGHAAGDDLLRTVAQRMRACLRHSEALARFGGDEFVVVLEEHDATRAALVADRILAAVSQRVVLRDVTLRPSASIGIAIASDGMTTDDLMHQADTALYAAKHHGKGRWQLYCADMAPAAVAAHS